MERRRLLRPGGGMTSVLLRLAQDPIPTLRAVLLSAPPSDIGHDDFDLHPEMRADTQSEAVKAAVLIPLILRPEDEGGPMLLFTRRTETLSRHSGQVSFPGGRCDPADLSPIETALRETREETGI